MSLFLLMKKQNIFHTIQAWSKSVGKWWATAVSSAESIPCSCAAHSQGQASLPWCSAYYSSRWCIIFPPNLPNQHMELYINTLLWRLYQTGLNMKPYWPLALLGEASASPKVKSSSGGRFYLIYMLFWGPKSHCHSSRVLKGHIYTPWVAFCLLPARFCMCCFANFARAIHDIAAKTKCIPPQAKLEY